MADQTERAATAALQTGTPGYGAVLRAASLTMAAALGWGLSRLRRGMGPGDEPPPAQPRFTRDRAGQTAPGAAVPS